jgi:KDO2-lipid IV(A) lauroyltransferase
MATRPTWSLKHAVNTVIGVFAIAMFKTLRLANPDWLSNVCGAVMRRFGPWLPEHKVGRANLAAAYPEKSPQEIETILLGVWDNLGRVGAEFAHLDRLWDYDPAQPGHGRILRSDESVQRMLDIRESGKPVLVFSAHLANWELASVATTSLGFDSAIIYRAPNIGAVADAVVEMRSGIMGTLIRTGLDAPVKAAEALKRGISVGMLVDQYSTKGVDVTFFGRPARTNPLIARLAQHFDCAIHGVHVVRHGGSRFRLHLTEPMMPVRDAQGDVDVPATMQLINDVVEGWVREHPEQWLWLHRRWR